MLNECLLYVSHIAQTSQLGVNMSVGKSIHLKNYKSKYIIKSEFTVTSLYVGVN